MFRMISGQNGVQGEGAHKKFGDERVEDPLTDTYQLRQNK
jgi:hypothetical protein